MSRNVLAGCAAVLLAAILGLAAADNARPWKRLQREFLELERRHLRLRLEAARAEAAGPLAELRTAIEGEEARLAERRDEIDQLELDLRRFRGRLKAARLRQDAIRAEPPPAGASASEALAAHGERLRQSRMEVESLRELVADREQKLEAVLADLAAARDRQTRERAPIEALERRLAAHGKASGSGSGVAVRELAVSAFPLADGSPRVDRCVTCHLGSAREEPAGESWPPPFRRHPRPELFLGADSPHPHGRFGCTVCHGGAGRATDFARAGHRPRDAEREAAWAEAWGWRREALPAEPMLALDLTEAACGRCHGAEVWTPEAPIHDAGIELIAALGCTGCHPSEHPALAGRPKAGPALTGIADKTRPAWVYRWLEAPRASRPTTRMPHFFDPSDASPAEQDRARRAAEIRAIVHVLWERSRPAAGVPAAGVPEEGDPEAGRALFDRLGCRGCHLLEPGAGTRAAGPGAGLPGARFGPHLAGTGSKVRAGWLLAWLEDPRSYRRETPMPSLRLDDREAADLTAFLMSRRDPAWEGLELPPVDEAARDALVRADLEQSHTLEASQARLKRMSEREKNAYLGERTIARYACWGCHEIAGFEQAPPAAPSLERAGRRGLPASHRPVYRLTATEARAVDVALLGLAGARPVTDSETAVLAAGRAVLARYNCRACHRIEGRDQAPGGADDGAPELTHAGARLESPWLYRYLADPGETTVRPWLTTRMPTFGLSAAERNALVRYFSALAGRDLLSGAPGDAPAARSPAVAVGRVVFAMLQCDACHADGGGAAVTDAPAPSYHLARDRLRADWVVDWILDPERWRPGTAMPASFRSGPGEPLDSSYLIGSIETPIFAVERERLLRLFDSEAELHAYLSDPERVAEALRRYLWTLPSTRR